MRQARKLNSLSFAVSVLAALIPAAGLAQSNVPIRIDVGSALVDGQHLQPYKNLWGMKVVKPDGTVLENAGTWTDQLEPIAVDGRACWKRTQLATYKRRNGYVAGTSTTINIFDKKTFAPVSREFEKHAPNGNVVADKITFKENSMKIEHTEKGKTAVNDLPTTPAFDFYGGIYAVLWAALPLKNGFSATFPSYTEDKHPETVTPVTYKIIGRETADAGSKGKVDSWVIDCDSMIGDLKYWVSDQAPYVIRMDYKQKDGPLWILTMI